MSRGKGFALREFFLTQSLFSSEGVERMKREVFSKKTGVCERCCGDEAIVEEDSYLKRRKVRGRPDPVPFSRVRRGWRVVLLRRLVCFE